MARKHFFNDESYEYFQQGIAKVKNLKKKYPEVLLQYEGEIFSHDDFNIEHDMIDLGGNIILGANIDCQTGKTVIFDDELDEMLDGISGLITVDLEV